MFILFLGIMVRIKSSYNDENGNSSTLEFRDHFRIKLKLKAVLKFQPEIFICTSNKKHFKDNRAVLEK